jgi:flagellar basal body-associated protein FliL
MDDQENFEQEPKKGYNKRSIWQWILIYIIAAVIVYGIIYLVLFQGFDGIKY